MTKRIGLVVGTALIAVGLAVGSLALGQHYTAGPETIPENLVGIDYTAVDQVGDGRLTIPSVNLDVPLGEMGTVGGIVNPPGFESAYVVRDLGTTDGTTFVAMHSLRNGAVGPGNAIFDVNEGRVVVEPGALVTVDGEAYRVTETSVIAKSELKHRADVWKDQPGRLVLITCLQNPQNLPSTHNAIVIAEQSEDDA